jgi:hypothetical protein
MICVVGVVAWHQTHRPGGRVFVFCPLAELPPMTAGGDNPWRGCLLTDGAMTAEDREILRAAIERYRARNPWPPRGGDRFEIMEGELVRL